MSDTYGNNSQNQNPAEAQEQKHVETQETAVEAITIPGNSDAPKYTWADDALAHSEPEVLAEIVVKQPVADTKMKAKKKVKTATKKPSKRSKAAELDEFGFRKGTIRSKAAQLYASAKGATLDEVKKKCGSIQYNMLTELKKRGFKVTSKEIEGKGNRPATRFFLKSKKR